MRKEQRLRLTIDTFTTTFQSLVATLRDEKPNRFLHAVLVGELVDLYIIEEE
ncbi:hypothetical protein [Candidatus Caldatribacterium sp.]|uniref:hypothetical protein n=1 Tax=Candidatus Caldatribacterium sp. TaxID=2282143 RepID=UPI00383E188A|nr:hypothetical protein [Candidatus Caldatribacterium sp.]